MGRKKLPREIRICLCGCNRTFECEIDSKKKFYNLECWYKYKIKYYTTPCWIEKETRICACGCGKTFVCRKTSKQKYIGTHGRKLNPQSKEAHEKTGKKNSINYKGKSQEERVGKEVSDIMKKNHSKLMKELWACPNSKLTSPERSQKMSIKRAKAIADGTFTPNSYHIHGHYTSSLSKESFYYRSFYELERMKQLDEQGILWTNRHDIVIKYLGLDGNIHRTVPDFLVYTLPKPTIEEPKNYLNETGHLKVNATKEWCEQNNYEYKVLFRDDIFKDNEDYKNKLGKFNAYQ
jgi:hypothetical protein